MIAVFYLKLNGKISKINEEVMPAYMSISTQSIDAQVAFPQGLGDNIFMPPIVRFVKFQRINTSLDDIAFFFHDGDPKISNL